MQAHAPRLSDMARSPDASVGTETAAIAAGPVDDGQLTIAKAFFRRLEGPGGFRDSALTSALTPLCETRGKAPAQPAVPQGIFARGRADHDLVVRLCQMPVDLAAPLLRSALPALDMSALLAILASTGAAHHALIAARPGLDWRVIKAILKHGHPEAARALAHNSTVDMDAEDQSALAAMASLDQALRAILRDQPRFTAARRSLALASQPLSHSNLKLAKLLRAGDRDGFVREAARRLNLDADTLLARLNAPSLTPLALLMCALGFDRAVYAELLPAWRSEHRSSRAHQTVHMPIFDMPADVARNRLMALAI